MIRRGGKKDKMEVKDPGAASSSEELMAPNPEESPKDTIEELTGLEKSLMKSRAVRDQQMEREASRQDLRWRGMQHQFQQIQVQVSQIMMEDEHQERKQDEEW